MNVASDISRNFSHKSRESSWKRLLNSLFVSCAWGKRNVREMATFAADSQKKSGMNHAFSAVKPVHENCSSEYGVFLLLIIKKNRRAYPVFIRIGFRWKTSRKNTSVEFTSHCKFSSNVMFNYSLKTYENIVFATPRKQVKTLWKTMRQYDFVGTRELGVYVSFLCVSEV